jgi:hypothetical protein
MLLPRRGSHGALHAACEGLQHRDMETQFLAVVDPFRLDLIVVDHSHSGAERRTISRDVEAGRLIRLRQGVYVERIAFEALRREDQHVVRMRALAAVSPGCPVFSHWSAAVLHGLPVMWNRLDTVHVTVEDEDDRHRVALTMHRFLIRDPEVVRFGDLVATNVGRTVVDVAGAAPFEEGVMVADAALAAGVPRVMLEEAAVLAGPRRAARRIAEVVGFAHPGAESAGESRTRVTEFRLGLEPPVLQHRLVLRDGTNASLDQYFPTVDIGAEFDGVRKFLDPRMAPEGAGAAVVAEKWREDEIRSQLTGLARFGWVQAGSQALLRGVLARVGVVRPRRRVTIADFIAAARTARPRRFTPTPRWRD